MKNIPSIEFPLVSMMVQQRDNDTHLCDPTIGNASGKHKQKEAATLKTMFAHASSLLIHMQQALKLRKLLTPHE